MKKKLSKLKSKKNFKTISQLDQNNIDVSVIVPMYNVENLIGETIASLKKNNCCLEILLIDDGSTDKTLENAKIAVNEDSRFKIIPKLNSGVSATRNLGLDRAKGKFILFVDSDDLMIDYAIDKLFYAALEQNADLTYGGIKRFNSTKTWTLPAHDKSNIFSVGYKKIHDNPELFLSIGPVAKLIHHSLLKNKKFPENIQFGEDQVIIFHALINAKKIFCIGDYIYLYRERDVTENASSITQQKDKKAYEYYSNIIDVLKKNRAQVYQLDQTNQERLIILKNYYDRAIGYEAWPLFVKILINRKDKISSSIELTREFISSLEEHEVNGIPALRYFFMRVLINHIHLIPIIEFNNYRNLIRSIIEKLNGKTQAACKKSWGKHWDHNYKLINSNTISAFLLFLWLREKKYYFSILNKNSSIIAKKYYFPFVRLLPVKKNKVIFATSNKGKASENFNYLLNELKKKPNKYDVKKFLGQSNQLKRKLYRYYHLATADVIFLESYYAPLYGLKPNKKTKVVQLWHACGAFKKFGFSALGQGDANSEEFERDAHSIYTHIIASSSDTGKLYAEAFDAPNEKIFPIGVPRTDFFFQAAKQQKIKVQLLKKYPALNNSINILYAPTFRGSPSQRSKFSLPFDWDICKKLPENYRLIIKLHPVVNTENIEIPKAYKNKILFLSSKEEINHWMVLCDILIADYSSLIFEYALLNKPIVFYAYDLDSYFDERGFFYPYNHYTYGDVATTQNELVEAILNAYERLPFFDSAREIFKAEFMSGCKGNASYNIIENIINK